MKIAFLPRIGQILDIEKHLHRIGKILDIEKPISLSKLTDKYGKKCVSDLLTRKNIKIMEYSGEIYFVDAKSQDFPAKEYRELGESEVFRETLKYIANNLSESKFKIFIKRLEGQDDRVKFQAKKLSIQEVRLYKFGIMLNYAGGIYLFNWWNIKKKVKPPQSKSHIRKYKEPKYIPPQKFQNYDDLQIDRSRTLER